MLLFAGLLSACATPVKQSAPEVRVEPQSRAHNGANWWYAKFRIAWPADAEPAWHLDVMLAATVIAPLLDQYHEAIAVWRFHRRASRDHAGHQFSFIFYAAPETAEQVFEAIRADPQVQALEKSGKLEKVQVDDTRNPRRPKIEDTSDRNWPLEIQRAWPYYIMGASRMWLELIQETAANSGEQAATPSEALYRKVSEQLDTLWKYEGQHAFLHHLNALFGYQPLLIIERKSTRF